MSVIFGKNSSPTNTPKRNTVDNSKQYNATFDYGYLYPIMCKEVLPTDSIKLDMAFGIRALPTAFPVQTKVRVNAHAFYVRSRTIFKDSQDFYSGTGDASSKTQPYISKAWLKKNLKSGTLADYLGLPTTYIRGEDHLPYIGGTFTQVPSILLNDQTAFSNDSDAWSLDGISLPEKTPSLLYNYKILENIANVDFKKGERYIFHFNIEDIHANIPGPTLTPDSFFTKENPTLRMNFVEVANNTDSLFSGWFHFVSCKLDKVDETHYEAVISLDCLREFKIDVTDNTPNPVPILLFYDKDGNLLTSKYTSILLDYVARYAENKVDVPETFIDSLPPINSLPMRAYEAIYNSFYRDNRNNPHMVNGVHKPNQYVTTLDGGEDNTDYELYRVNWEQDYMTSAVPSPQQGNAPLVGITSTGKATFSDENGVNHTVQLQTAEDGDTVIGATYSSDVPQSVARSLVNMATSGFSINDFRGVNALTRFLEINMRRGLKYKDVIESHFGKSPTYEELDMPEFLGGFTKIFDSTQVNQTTESESSPLGSYAGQLSAVGGTNHTITKYFDEPGYFIVVLSITPVPCYTQSIPKLFLKHELLDYYFPEFGHIGYQPIEYSEVAPFQALGHGKSLTDVFGYQRAWYDYLADYDTAHGNFRDYLRDFVIYRRFNTPPSLTPEFLTVNSDQINNVFTVNPSEYKLDPFLGQIHFRAIWKRPIPLFGVPKLEYDS